jgi:hypothetical protein
MATVSSSPPQSPPGGPIAVVVATYGGACGAPSGNATASVATECGGKLRCDYVVNNRYGDPVPMCPKDFVVQYRCGADPAPKQAGHAATVNEGYAVTLDCGGPPPAP